MEIAQKFERRSELRMTLLKDLAVQRDDGGDLPADYEARTGELLGVQDWLFQHLHVALSEGSNESTWEDVPVAARERVIDDLLDDFKFKNPGIFEQDEEQGDEEFSDPEQDDNGEVDVTITPNTLLLFHFSHFFRVYFVFTFWPPSPVIWSQQFLVGVLAVCSSAC